MKATPLLIQTFLSTIFAAAAMANPTGFLNASSNFVLADTNVELNWKINLPPMDITEMIDFQNPQKMIQPRQNVLAEVRVLGAALGPTTRPMFAEALVEAGNSGVNTIFSGWADGLGANSSNTFYLTSGQRLDFEFKTWNRSRPDRSQDKWGSLRTPVKTGTGDERLIILKDGDQAPSFNAAFDQAGNNAFIVPYLEEDGTTINIGPNDLIIFAELNERVNAIADFQDFVVLVTFTSA